MYAIHRLYIASWISGVWNAPYPGKMPGIPAPFARPSLKLLISGTSGQENLHGIGRV